MGGRGTRDGLGGRGGEGDGGGAVRRTSLYGRAPCSSHFIKGFSAHPPGPGNWGCVDGEEEAGWIRKSLDSSTSSSNTRLTAWQNITAHYAQPSTSSRARLEVEEVPSRKSLERRREQDENSSDLMNAHVDLTPNI